ncbi:pilin [Mangrovihabitans endophyticus]|uniref:TrbC/VIRB2 family protein n=1 Tax=Mangrovihabitans endophyticus TaxID=1751298 RepID=A0A8J3C5I2_9ACTN|nr:pilin [Mangrovihabitans endophyticus]GGL12568.1 hypothetical protein GCM10012284_54030 [Mangrovihabitans endophyticus]
MSRRNISRLLLVFTVTVAAVAVSVPASAAAAPVIVAAHSLPVIVSNITRWIIGLLFGVATLFLTVGGLRYLAAGGDPGEVEKAKSALKSALIGYALAILAPVLLAVVRGWIGG